MALFTDGSACTINDLADEDSGLLATAATVGVNVSAKLRLAMDELQSEIEVWLSRSRPAFGPPWIQGPGIGQVAVTPELKRWQKMLALSMVYRDAYFTQLVDRYQGKWDEYSKLTRYSRDQFIASGVGIVTDPLPKASLPVLGTVSATPQQAGGTFYARVSWVNQAGEEGAPSDASSIVTPAGNLMTVMSWDPPPNAVGFNVYAGSILDTLERQDDVALPIGGTFTYIPGSATGTGGTPQDGQKPNYIKALPRLVSRG